MAIKDEVGGNSGYLKKVRNYFLPSSKEMAELASERYQTTLGGGNVYEKTNDNFSNDNVNWNYKCVWRCNIGTGCGK